MVQAKIIKDDIRYLLFADIYTKYSEPKTRRKAFAILESAIATFDKKGFENVTLTMIARESGVTRQLLNHYFESLNELRALALKYIRVIGQRIVVNAIPTDAPADQMLKGYFEAHQFWARNYKVHLRVWLGFLNSCAKNKSDREMNIVSVAAGTNRLEELLKAGKASGIFTVPDAREAARLIQTLMLGWLVSSLTEDDGINSSQLETSVVKECLRIAGAKA